MRSMIKDSGQVTKRTKQFKLGHLGTLNQVIVALGKTIRAMADGSVDFSGGLSDCQWLGDHAAVPGDQDAGPARGTTGPDREHRGGIWHDKQSHELTSRIEDLAERRTPRRGPLIIVGADKAECRKRLEEILATGEQPAHVRFIMTVCHAQTATAVGSWETVPAPEGQLS